jgi:hypothetical protein
MAIFSAIATAIVTSIGLTGITATIVGGIISAGLAYGTAKATGMFKMPPSLSPTGQTKDPGVRVTVAPSTDNKLPVLYGKAFTSGPVIDAGIKNQNNTMVYCIALSEETDSGSFTINNVYINDAKLTFSGTSNAVASITDPNGTTDSNAYVGNVRVNVYAGGTNSSQQIFPGTQINAYSIMPHWTGGGDPEANDLVFAMVEIDYDPANGLTGLPPMTFDMENSLKNPGNVLLDYLNNSVYGAGLSNTIIDTSSIIGTANTQMAGFCDETVNYVDSSNVTQTQSRYEINGVISTFNDVKDNIDRICQAGGTFFSFDNKTGQFNTVPNRKLSTAELANCLTYNDDKIVSKIDISSTDLFSLYNSIEVEFADATRKDQTNTIKIDTPGSDRNANEPDNVLKYGIDLINDQFRAERLANIDLNQSRLNTVIQFETDFSGMQTDVGDVIKVTNSLYGYTDKLFKVMRTREVEKDTGMVTVEMTAIEYADSVYEGADPVEFPAALPIDIPRIPIMPPGAIILPIALNDEYGNLTVSDKFRAGVIDRNHMRDLSSGGQIEDKPATKDDLGSTTTYANLFTRRELDFTAASGLEAGDYSFMSAGSPIGAANANPASAAIRANVQVEYANSTVQTEDFFVFNNNFTQIPSIIEANKKITVGPNAVSGNVVLQGYNTLDQNAGGQRGFSSIRYDMIRLNKGDVF